ncbi:MAG: DNA recombination protein RmuC [Patescibacteria group bacterium]
MARWGRKTESLIHAAKYHVIVSALTSFLPPTCKRALQGLRAMHIEEQAKEIRKRVEDLQRHMSAYEQYFTSLGRHLGTAVGQYNLAGKEFSKIDKDVLKISGQGIGYEAIALERPNDDHQS